MAVVFTVLMVMAGIYALFKWPIPTLAVLGVLIVIGKSGENKNGGTAPTTAPPSAKPKAPSSPIKPQAQPTAAVRRCEGRDYEARLLRARTESFKIITMQGEAKAAADILSKASGNVDAGRPETNPRGNGILGTKIIRGGGRGKERRAQPPVPLCCP